MGNSMIASLRRHLERAVKSYAGERRGIKEKRFGLVTLHRPANVDDDRQLAEILETRSVISVDLLLYWPVHPRTRARIDEAAIPKETRVLGVSCLSLRDNTQRPAAIECGTNWLASPRKKPSRRPGTRTLPIAEKNGFRR
jgi:UDP-N-acetylglucosamine 2-epimerase (non-hydrolysing)